MSKRLSIKKDFLQCPQNKVVNLPKLGKMIREDINLENNSKLKEFYDRNYRKGYVLGDLKLFNWMFKNNGGFVATLSNKGTVAAHQGHVPIVFTDGVNDYKGFISASTMTDINYRRMGLMSYLREDVQSNYEMAASIGGSPLGVKLYTAMGYKFYGVLKRMVGVVDDSLAKGISKNNEKIKKTVEANDIKNPGVKQIARFEEISSELDKLTNDVLRKNNYFGVKRDWEFLDWRYVEHPYFDYKRFGLWANDELQAVVVFRHEVVENVGKIIRIVENIGHEDVLRELISSVLLKDEVLEGVAWVDWYCSSQVISDILRPLGFLSSEELNPIIFPHFCSPVDYFKKEYPFMFWAKNDDLFKKAPTNLEHWYVTKGDGDADRPNDAWVTPEPENENLKKE